MVTKLHEVPQQLKQRRAWVVHRNKEPYTPVTGVHAKSNDPGTWATFEDAMACVSEFDGVGIMFDEGLAGADLDDCISDDGQVHPEAQQIVDALNSYTERSPSGNGLHVLFFGEVPEGRKRKIMSWGGHCELYSSGRFFTVTSDHVEGTPRTVQYRQPKLEVLHKALFPPKATEREKRTLPGKPGLTTEELLKAAFGASNGAKIRRLLNGDDSDYPSASEADADLCHMLAFYSGGDMQCLEAPMRQSRRVRDKWDKRRGGNTWLENEITRSIARCREFYTPPRQRDADPDRGEPAAAENREAPTAWHPWTELGNAERLVAKHGESMRYCGPRKSWYVWDGRRWARDETDQMSKWAKLTVRAMYAEASAIDDDKERDAFIRFARSSEKRTAIGAMIGLAESEPGVPILADDLDHGPYLLNVENGTIDLRTGELRAHDPHDLITKLTPVDYDADAECPTWISFISHIMGENEALISFLQLAIGYSLTGATDERALFIMHGGGQNGKSTLIETVMELLGQYATKAAFSTFFAKRQEGVRNDVARLHKARFVAASEIEQGRRLAEALVKELTGRDTIVARFLYQDEFDFVPEFKIWLAANHKPEIRGTDKGIWSRIRLIPFDVTIPDDQQDFDLPDKLKAELPGILRWALGGCIAWQSEGLGQPSEVAEATSRYRDEMDAVAEFISECCVLSPNAEAWASSLYPRYKQWCEGNGDRPMTHKMFGGRLTERGLKRKRSTGGRHRWLGIGLRAEVDESAPPDYE